MHVCAASPARRRPGGFCAWRLARREAKKKRKTRKEKKENKEKRVSRPPRRSRTLYAAQGCRSSPRSPVEAVLCTGRCAGPGGPAPRAEAALSTQPCRSSPRSPVEAVGLIFWPRTHVRTHIAGEPPTHVARPARLTPDACGTYAPPASPPMHVAVSSSSSK